MSIRENELPNQHRYRGKVGKLSRYMFFILICLVIFPERGASAELLFSSRLVKYNEANKHYFNRIDHEKVMHLSAAKNETVSFQLVLKVRQKEETQIQFRKHDFSGPETLKAENIELFMLENCQSDYAPDCLIPMRDSDRFVLRAQEANPSYKVVWVDFYVPMETQTGDFHGNIELIRNSESPIQIKIALKVYPFSLPEKPSLKVDLNNYGLGFLKRSENQAGSKEKSHLARDFYRFAGKHRMILNPLPYKSQRGRPHSIMAPGLTGEGDAIRVKDWSVYDALYAPLFDGTLFKNQIPIDHQYLPFNPEWPSPFSNYLTDRKKYETEWRLIAEEFISHFKEKEWDQTTFQIFLNQKPRKNNRIPWNLDEPKGVSDYQALRYYADLTHRVFKGESAFQFRIDISHFYCEKHQGNPKKDFRVNRGDKILSPVDIWVISKHSMDDHIPQQKALALKNKKKTIYEYMAGGRMPLIQDRLMKAVQYGWKAWLRHEDGLVFWNTIKNKTSPSDGRNFLIYSESRGGNPYPIASIRLKAIRRGAQDFEYLRLASKKGDVRGLLKNHLSNEQTSDVGLRNKLAAMIVTGKN